MAGTFLLVALRVYGLDCHVKSKGLMTPDTLWQLPSRISHLSGERFTCSPYGTGETFILTVFQKQVLAVCQQTGTASTMVDRAANLLGMSDFDRKHLHRTIIGFVKAGLLVPIRVAKQHEPHPIVPTPVSTLCFPTAERPNVLARAIRSFERHLRKQTYGFETIVSDDSDSTKVTQMYAATLHSLKLEHNMKVRYASRSDRMLYISELAKQGITRETAVFALLGARYPGVITTGSAQNTILLDCLDKHILCVDDDVLCRTVTHPERRAGALVQGHLNPREQWFFSSRSKLRTNVSWDCECQLFSEQIQILGKKLSSIVLSEDRETAHSHLICPHLHKVITTDCSARVLITVPGVVGDSGAYSFLPWLTIRGRSLSRLVQDEEAMNAALASRQLLSVSQQTTVTHNEFCQSMAIGLANDSDLPPFLPIGRNQDGAFGTLIQLSSPGAIAHLPIAVSHLPCVPRKSQAIPEFRIAEMIIALMKLVCPPHRIGSAGVVALIGRELEYIATLPSAELLEQLTRASDFYFDGVLASVEQSLAEQKDRPAFFLIAVKEYRDLLEQARCEAAAMIPVEFRAHLRLSEAVAVLRSILISWGRVLQIWPDMVECARFLSEKGIRISMPV